MIYINKYLDYLKTERRYSQKTITSYYGDLVEYDDFIKNNCIEILDINYDVVNRYLKYLYEKKISKSSISRKLSSIRGLYNYLIRENIVSINYFNEVSNPKKDLYLPRFLKREELDKIFSVCDNKNPIEQRDTLVMELLYATGLRVSELVNIKVANIDQKNRTIKVLGKGSKERIVIFNNHTKEAMDIYLRESYKTFNKEGSQYLILNKNGNKLSERYVRNIVDKFVRKAGLNIKIGPHTLRHTFATDMLENGSDLMTVKELLGHESLNTTSIYTHVTNEHIKKTFELAHPRAKK